MSNVFWDDDDDCDYTDDDHQEDADYDTGDANDEDEDSEQDDNEDDINDEDDSEENTEDEKTENTDTGEVSRSYAQNSIIKQHSSNSPSFHGYGKCMRYLCNCQHFESISGNTCSNCGHNYSDHW